MTDEIFIQSLTAVLIVAAEVNFLTVLLPVLLRKIFSLPFLLWVAHTLPHSLE